MSTVASYIAWHPVGSSSRTTWRAWSGYAFEGICIKHIASLKRALGIEAVETTESAWHHRPVGRDDRGAQVDLVIDRRDASVNLCEMKFSEGVFAVFIVVTVSTCG